MIQPIKILQNIRAPIAVGVSGGADSMCLLSLVLRCGFFSNSDITVLHVNHNLRPTAMRDCNLVQEFCVQNNLQFKVFSPNIAEMAQKNKRSIETEARECRRELFGDFCTKNGATLLLAHNADDQAETILMHIFRGCGIGGLAGMSAEEQVTVAGGVMTVARPLLSITKREIYEYNQANNIPFCEDETNSDTKYARNHIRKLLSEVENTYGGAKSNLVALSDLASKNRQFIASAMNKDYIFTHGDAVILDKNALKSDLLAGEYIMAAASKAGLTHDLEYKHIDAVLKNADNVGGELHLPHGFIVAIERGHIAFYKKRQASHFFRIHLTEEGIYRLGDDKITIEQCNKADIKNAKTSTYCFDYKAINQPRTLYADLDILEGALLRYRQDGDTFLPFSGCGGKLKEFLCAKHIPSRLRDTIPLLCKDHIVLAIVGVEISQTAAITDKTTNAARITYVTQDKAQAERVVCKE